MKKSSKLLKHGRLLKSSIPWINRIRVKDQNILIDWKNIDVPVTMDMQTFKILKSKILQN